MAENVVKQITDELSQIFRHLLPGLAIMGAAAASHPSWFKPWYSPVDGWHVAILAAVALTVGNIWYIVHRYVVHQFIDYLIVADQRKDWKFKSYKSWLGAHIDKNFHLEDCHKRLADHLHFRSAQIIFLFIIAEATIVFSIRPETGSFFERYHYWSLYAGIALFLWCMFVQYPISHSIDLFVAARYGKTPETGTDRQTSED